MGKGKKGPVCLSPCHISLDLLFLFKWLVFVGKIANGQFSKSNTFWTRPALYSPSFIQPYTPALAGKGRDPKYRRPHCPQCHGWLWKARGSRDTRILTSWYAQHLCEVQTEYVSSLLFITLCPAPTLYLSPVGSKLCLPVVDPKTLRVSLSCYPVPTISPESSYPFSQHREARLWSVNVRSGIFLR